MIHQALTAVHNETTVEKSFDGLFAYPKAFRHFHKLQTIQEPLELNSPSSATKLPINLKLLRKGKSASTYENNLKRRLVRRITDAKAQRDSELIQLISDKSLPSLSFHDKREISEMSDVKEHLKEFLEEQKSKSKKPYISGQELVNKLRRKTLFIQPPIKSRSGSIRTLAESEASDLDISPTKLENGLFSNRLMKKAQTMNLRDSNNSKQKGTFDFLSIGNQDSMLDSPTEEHKTDSGGLFDQNSQSTITPHRNTELSPKKSVLRPPKYGKKSENENNDEINLESSLKKLRRDTKTLTANGPSRDLRKIREMESFAAALSELTNDERNDDDEFDSDRVLEDFKRALENVEPTQAIKHSIFRPEKSTLSHDLHIEKTKSENTINQHLPLILRDQTSTKNWRQHRNTFSNLPGLEQERFTSYADTCTKETQKSFLRTDEEQDADVQTHFKRLDDHEVETHFGRTKHKKESGRHEKDFLDLALSNKDDSFNTSDLFAEKEKEKLSYALSRFNKYNGTIDTQSNTNSSPTLIKTESQGQFMFDSLKGRIRTQVRSNPIEFAPSLNHQVNLMRLETKELPSRKESNESRSPSLKIDFQAENHRDGEGRSVLRYLNKMN